MPKLDTLIGAPLRSGSGSCRRLAETADARSFLLNLARFSFDIHFGFASPGSRAHGPIASPLLLILFHPPFGCFGSNHWRKSSENISSNSSLTPFFGVPDEPDTGIFGC